MKTTIFTLLIACTLPMVLMAQPTVTINEFYGNGDFSMMNCSPDLGAGAGGAGVTWDFSGVSSFGNYSTISVRPDTSVIFTTCNQMQIWPDGNMYFIQGNSTDSYVFGMRDIATGVTTYYSGYDESKRPFTYGNSYVDTFRVIVPSAGAHGGVIRHVTADGYGTLKIPSGTYNNVLRIRKYATELDTLTTGEALIFTTSYLWFDSVHVLPLFRLDSVTSSSAANTQTAMYYPGNVGVAALSNPNNAYKGYLDNNGLRVSGAFGQGNVYRVALYTITGTQIINTVFEADGPDQRFTAGELAPGMYVVAITPQNDPAGKAVIKVVKR